jgi:hypothetical protein
MTDPWVCIDCGARQRESGACRACAHEDTLDARDERVRSFMYDVDLRLGQRREARVRFVGVGVGMAIVFALWTVPGYWQLRGTLYPGLPVLLDQWLLMALIGLGTSKLAERLLRARKRFPYLRDDHSIADDDPVRG